MQKLLIIKWVWNREYQYKHRSDLYVSGSLCEQWKICADKAFQCYAATQKHFGHASSARSRGRDEYCL